MPNRGDDNNRIIGGVQTDIGEYPWQVRIKAKTSVHHILIQVAILEDSPDLSRLQRCGGSLISNKHVLTAGGCVSDDRTYFVHLGDTILGNNKDVNYNKTVEIIKIDLHPDYDTVAGINNIAVLEMAEPVPLNQYPNIKPVCLPDQGADFSRFKSDFTETTATVTGWGETENGEYNSWLHEVQVTVFADEECEDITSTQLCAGVMEGDEAPCVGDDGGPLVVSDPNVNNNGLTIAGIIFYEDCNLVETYTKVSMFTDWIIDIIGDATTCPPPP